MVEFRECDLVAQGVGTITITVTGATGNSDTYTFAINSADRPVTINQMGSCQSHDAYFSIESTATDSNDAAPRVYRVTWGIEELMTARAAQ